MTLPAPSVVPPLPTVFPVVVLRYYTMANATTPVLLGLLLVAMALAVRLVQPNARNVLPVLPIVLSVLVDLSPT